MEHPPYSIHISFELQDTKNSLTRFMQEVAFI